MRDGLRRLIVSGTLPLGEKLPSVRELSTQLTINPNTIQRAYRELETEGYICSVAGRGSYVCAQIPDDPARQDALLRAFDSGNHTEAQFADMYGLTQAAVALTLEKARRRRDVAAASL